MAAPTPPLPGTGLVVDDLGWLISSEDEESHGAVTPGTAGPSDR